MDEFSMPRGDKDDSIFCPQVEIELRNFLEELKNGEQTSYKKIFMLETLDTEEGLKELWRLNRDSDIFGHLWTVYGPRRATFGLDNDGNLYAYNIQTGKYKNEGSVLDEESRKTLTTYLKNLK